MQNLRRGFTLIELLVTMGIIIVLLSLAVGVSNSSTLDSYKVIGAGDRLAQSLLTAKSRAARDKAPRGIRILAGTDGYLRELIYIEQPEPWLPDQSETHIGNAPNKPGRSLLVLKYPQKGGTNPAGTFPKPVPAECRAYLVLSTADVSTLINQLTGASIATVTSPDFAAGFSFDATTFASTANVELESIPKNPDNSDFGVYKLMINSNPTPIVDPDLCAGQTPTANPTRGTIQTVNFGVYLPARPLAGEPTVILSKNAAVDPLACLPQLAVGASQDILFAPSGQVMFRSEGIIAFLVRDTFKFTPTSGTVVSTAQNLRAAGETVLVAVYPKNGSVSTKPVAEPDGTAEGPYKFAKDAINSGL